MRLTVLSIILFLSGFVSAQFIPNKGQWEDNVLFKKDLPGGALFFENDRLTYNLMHPEDAEKIHGHAHRVDSTQKDFRFHSFQMNFLNANSQSIKSGVNPLKEKMNYFKGNDKSKWASNISPCEKVKYSELYKGIDFLFYTEMQRLKYDFVVHAGADVSDIKLVFSGADRVYLNNNELKIKLSFTEIIEQIPIAYQIIKGRKVSVPCSFVLFKNVVSFKLGDSYRKEYDLVIDPVLIFSTYSGSAGLNFGYTATFDDDGFLYAGGSVFEIGYPVTAGAYDISFNSLPSTGNWGVSDIAITKYDSSGTSRIYSTYLGGNRCEVPHSIVVNSKGELIIYGSTGSSDYPVTVSAVGQTFGGGTTANLANGIYINYTNGSDVVISKLSADGGQLLASTYFGGSGNDGLNLFLDYNYADQMRGDVVVDKQDNIYIASCTYSTNIAGVSGFQNTNKGTSDGLVAKFNTDLSTLIWASYIGGTNRDAAYSIVLDENEDIIVAGGTTSNNLATTPGVLFPSYQGAPSDGFIAKISNDGMVLNALTYFGTHTYDQTYFVKLDKEQNVYVYGQSASMDSTLVKNASYYSIESGQFISKLKNDLSDFIWSTTFGSGDGRINISPTAFMVDLCNKIYLSGWGSPDAGFSGIPNYLVGGIGYNGARGTNGMPVTPDAFQSTTDGSDFYIMVLEDDASALAYGSFFGGNISHEHVDGGTSRFDRKGKIYQSMCAGCGGNSDMPIKPVNAVSPTNNSNCNNGVFKMDFLLPNVVADFKSFPACVNYNYQFKNTSLLQSNTSFYWDFGDGDTSTVFQPNHTFKSVGVYDVMLVLNDPTSCNLTDTIIKKITVSELPIIDLKDTLICKGELLQLGFPPLADPEATYLWTPSEKVSDSLISNPTVEIDSSTIFKIVVNSLGCTDTFDQSIIVPVIDFVVDTSFCNQQDSIVPIKVTTLKGKISTYIWSSSVMYADTLNIDILDSVFSYKANNGITTLYLKVTDSIGCVLTDSFHIYKSQPEQKRNDLLCSGESLSMGYSAYNGNGINYDWSPGIWLNDSTISNPVATPSDSIKYKLLVDIGGVCIDTLEQKLKIQILQFIVPDTTFCNQKDSVVSMEVLTLKGKVASYIWSSTAGYNDTLNSNILDSTFSIEVENGKRNFYLLLVDSVGCLYKDTISVYKSQPKEMDTNSICPSINILIGYSQYLGNNNIYNWSPGKWLSDSTIYNPIASPLASIDYTLLINIGGVCTDTLIESFIIPEIDIDAKGDSVYCNSALSMSNGWVNIIKGKSSQFVWSHNSVFSDTLNSDLSNSAVSLTIIDGVNKFYVQMKDTTGCLVSDSIVIIKDILQADLPLEESFCQNDTMTLKVTSPQWTSSIKVAWMDTVDILSGANSQIIQLKNIPGNLKVYAQLTDSAGCTAKDSSEIYISDLFPDTLKAWADKDTILLGGSTVIHVLPNGNKYLWTPFESLNDATKQHPLASPAITTLYQVALSDPGNLSCTFKTDVTVYVYDAKCGKDDVYVPNIFTPNGDGKNDVLYVRGNNITELYFTIYDRWGEPVFETNDQSVGWNGDYKNKNSDPAVFVYYLTIKCGDGKEYFEKGNITVMR